MHPKAILELCAELLALVLRFEHPSDAVVSRFFRDHKGLGPRERSTIAETIYAVLRRKLFFEHLAPSGSGARQRRLAILGFAAPPEFLAGALTDVESNWLAQCREVRPSELMERHRHNLPDWLAQALKQQLGAGFWPLVDALDQTAGLDLRVNSQKAKREDVQTALARSGISSTPTPFSPWGLRVSGKPALTRLELFQRGEAEIQDEGSQLLALLVDAKRGEMVVDFCAGAGGKTLALGAMMRNTGRLYAFDTSAHRLDALKPRLARSGLSNVHPAALAHERDERVKRLAGKIDRVLVDAPCSGLGTLRRNPDLKWRQDANSITELALAQSSILASAARLVKPGGRLVYTTCSMLVQENESVAEQFSANNADFRTLDVGEAMAALKLPDPFQLCAGGVSGHGFLRLWPHLHQTDAFFAAIWEKK